MFLSAVVYITVQGIMSWGTGFHTCHVAQERHTMGMDNLSCLYKLTLGEDIIGNSIRKHCCLTTWLLTCLRWMNQQLHLVVREVSAEWAGDGDMPLRMIMLAIILQLWWSRHVTSSGQSSIQAIMSAHTVIDHADFSMMQHWPVWSQTASALQFT